MTIRRIALLTVAVAALLALLPSLRVRAGGEDVADHLPIDPVAAGVYDLDLLDWIDTWVGRIGRMRGTNGDEAAKYFAELDEKAGMSFRDDVLGAFGPGIAFAVAFPSDDEQADGGWSEKTLYRDALRQSVLVARIDSHERAIKALEGLMRLAGGELTVAEDRKSFVVNGSSLGLSDEGDALHGHMKGNLLVISGSPARAARALAGFPRGARLIDGSDYGRVAAQVEPDPESVMYVNLPKIRTWLEGSGEALGISGHFGPYLDDDWMGVGMISATARTDGGLRTSHFGPEPLAGGLASMWFSGMGGSPTILMALGQLVEGVARSGGPSGQAKRTLSDLRSVGTAIEEYSIDNNRYPASGGWVPIDAIRSEISPVYVRDLPTTDGWGHPILYWSDGTSYRIVSPGADGVIDGEWSGDVSGHGKTTDPNADVVFADGSFAAWPEGR